VAQLKNIV